MLEEIHEDCGVALIRLLKPLDYYEKKYGSRYFGLNKLYLLMEKQHNRGQEGAGMACVDLDIEPGNEYMFRERAEGANAITEIFSRVKEGFLGQLYMGHLRYSTTGKRESRMYILSFAETTGGLRTFACVATST